MTPVKQARRRNGASASAKRKEIYSRPAWERMVRIHELIQDKEFPDCAGLATDFEVTTRTIKRDVDFMKCRLELPIEYDWVRHGYFYSRPVDRFPHVAITEAEVFALLVAHKAIAQYRGTPFEKPLQAAFQRLTGQLDQSARFTLGDLGEMVSFRPFAPEDTDLKTFQLLTQAVRERRALTFMYRNLGAAAAERRQVHPYHLACIENHWYLFAFDVVRAAMRTFSLTRLQEPVLTSERFAVPEKFNAAEYLKGSFSAFKGNADYEVVVDFDAWAADLVRGRTWHGGQELTELPGGGVRLRMRLDSIEEVERWVLGWGGHATVVRPEALVRRVGEAAREIWERLKTKD